MCGIAGFVSSTIQGERAGDDSRLSILKRMTDRMKDRGPDGQGQWISEPAGHSSATATWKAALGHRRLSIIDVEGGAQPLSNETGRVRTSFNGEIFNFLELRPALERQGHRFKTRSDTEVLVHHFEEHGEAGLSALNGMFALAIWDQDHCRLTLARDRAGVKPLYYARLADGGIAFASTMSAIAEHPGVSRRISGESLVDYFFSDYVHAPEAIFEDVRKLEPGHYLVWEEGKLLDPRPFWEGSLERERDCRDIPALASELRELLDASVRRQLISDVPLGVFLSGGIDSSIVAALASGIASKSGGDAIRTFSIAFEDRDFDESAYARLVARQLRTDHREETLSEGNLLEHLDDALNCLDEPLADPSILPTFVLSRLAAGSVKVALGGDGGDELFAGYPTYRAHRYSRIYERVPEMFRKNVLEPAISRLPVKLSYQSLEWKAKRFALRWDSDPMRRHLRWLSATDTADLPEIFLGIGPGADFSEPRVLRFASRAAVEAEASDPLNPCLALDFRTYLPGSVLAKVDRASMANSLEVRPPFLDNALIDWAFGLPGHVKLRGGVSKFLLKEMARNLLPQEVVFRRKKGFAIPLGRWLRGPLRARLDSIFRDSPAWSHPALRREGFARWAEQHQEGRADRSKPLWSLLVLDHWMRKEGVA